MSDPAALRVLVLDDDHTMLALLQHQLRDLGVLHIEVFDNGFRALDVIDASRFAVDLIFCDLMMPEMDGLEFVRHLDAKGWGGGLVLISGADERITQAAERLVRATGVSLLGSIGKPVSRELLAPMLQRREPLLARGAQVTRAAYGLAELRAAIEGDELENFYQPKVDLASGAFAGVEALVRWRHPVDGLVFPDQFIGVAEANGMIDDLTRIVLSSAVEHARTWQMTGTPLKVAVNVSMSCLDDLDFPDFVAAVTARAGLAPQDVTLEVTESRLMNNLRHSLEILTRLRLKGFCLSIDDFGTGHSSLAQLRDLPFNQLKIDRGFVHGAALNRTTQAIYTSSLTMGMHLQMQVVAEGVEDAADWEFLRRTGCHVAQGYFIARPMPAADLGAWLATWNQTRRSGSAA